MIFPNSRQIVERFRAQLRFRFAQDDIVLMPLLGHTVILNEVKDLPGVTPSRVDSLHL